MVSSGDAGGKGQREDDREEGADQKRLKTCELGGVEEEMETNAEPLEVIFIDLGGEGVEERAEGGGMSADESPAEAGPSSAVIKSEPGPGPRADLGVSQSAKKTQPLEGTTTRLKVEVIQLQSSVVKKDMEIRILREQLQLYTDTLTELQLEREMDKERLQELESARVDDEMTHDLEEQLGQVRDEMRALQKEKQSVDEKMAMVMAVCRGEGHENGGSGILSSSRTGTPVVSPPVSASVEVGPAASSTSPPSNLVEDIVDEVASVTAPVQPEAQPDPPLLVVVEIKRENCEQATSNDDEVTPPPPQLQPGNVNLLTGNEEVTMLHSAERNSATKCICGKTFASNTNLEWHLRRYNEEWKFKCECCNEKFFSTSYLRDHMKQKHERKLRKSVAGCHGCGRIFATYGKMLQHKKESQRESGCGLVGAGGQEKN